jgi:hypothetical protein
MRFGVEQDREGCGYESEDESVYDEHGEYTRVEDVRLKTDVEDDQCRQGCGGTVLAFFLGGKQRISITLYSSSTLQWLLFADVETTKLGCTRTGSKFGYKGEDADENCVSPCHPVVEKTQVGSETRKSEVLFDL